MPTNTADQQIPLPIDADTADAPVAFTSYTGVVENRLVRRYTNDADRTARDTAPVKGQLTHNNTTLDLYDGVLYREIPPLFSRLSADSAAVNNSAVLVNSGISFPVRANAIYEFRTRQLCSSGTTPDIKFGFTFPVGLTMVYVGMGIPVAGANITYQNLIQTSNPTFEGAGADFTVLFMGLIVVGVNAGTLALQFAQATANASNTILRAQTYGVLHRVA